MPQEYISQSSIFGQRRVKPPLIYIESFEEERPADTQGIGSDFVAAISFDQAHDGIASFELTTRTTSAQAGDTVTLTTNFPYHNQRLLTFSADFLASTAVDSQYFTIAFSIQDGTNSFTPGIRFDFQNNIWQARDSANAWQNITGSTYSVDDDQWQAVRLSIDLTNIQYTLLQAGGLNLSTGFPATFRRLTPGTNLHELSIELTFSTNANESKSVYIDNLVLEAT